MLLLAGCAFDARPLSDAASQASSGPSWTPKAWDASLPATDAAVSDAAKAKAGMSSAATGSAPRGGQRAPDATTSVSMHDAGGSSPGSTASADEDAGARPLDAGATPASTDAAPGNARAVSEFVAAATAALRTRGKGGSDTELKRWRNSARNGTRLTPELVTPALTRIAQSATCFVRPNECINVCIAMEQDCEPCLDDSTCKAVLLQVCGSVPGGICGL